MTTRHVCNTSEGDRRHLIMMLPARFAATSYLRRFLPLENRPHETFGTTLVSRIVGCWCLRSEAMLDKWVGDIRWPAGSGRGSRVRATRRPARPGHARA